MAITLILEPCATLCHNSSPIFSSYSLTCGVISGSGGFRFEIPPSYQLDNIEASPCGLVLCVSTIVDSGPDLYRTTYRSEVWLFPFATKRGGYWTEDYRVIASSEWRGSKNKRLYRRTLTCSRAVAVAVDCYESAAIEVVDPEGNPIEIPWPRKDSRYLPDGQINFGSAKPLSWADNSSDGPVLISTLYSNGAHYDDLFCFTYNLASGESQLFQVKEKADYLLNFLLMRY